MVRQPILVIRPGTDALLALGMIETIVGDGLAGGSEDPDRNAPSVEPPARRGPGRGGPFLPGGDRRLGDIHHLGPALFAELDQLGEIGRAGS
jgi:hypothetical protein